jgi:putative DNA primase/helicase
MQQQAINIQEPNWLEPIFENIPEELRQQPWAVWKAEPKLDDKGKHNGKWSKAPRNPLTGKKIGSNQPNKFGTFEQAKNAYKSGNYTGVGVLLTGCGLIGIDIDDGKTIFKTTPALIDWLKKASEEGAYIEKSPSGNGLRIFVYGNLNANGTRVGGLEIYKDVRFLTITGDYLPPQGGNRAQ